MSPAQAQAVPFHLAICPAEQEREVFAKLFTVGSVSVVTTPVRFEPSPINEVALTLPLLSIDIPPLHPFTILCQFKSIFWLAVWLPKSSPPAPANPQSSHFTWRVPLVSAYTHLLLEPANCHILTSPLVAVSIPLTL